MLSSFRCGDVFGSEVRECVYPAVIVHPNLLPPTLSDSPRINTKTSKGKARKTDGASKAQKRLASVSR